MSPRRHFPAAPVSVTNARRFALSRLPHADDEARERVELMVSELAANCVVHAASDFEVTITQKDDVLRVEVTDIAEGQPTVQWPDPMQPKGRGLQIVSALADQWGVEPAPGGRTGKTVWFTLEVPSAVGQADRRSRR
jgi:anti-sigma regulatory factor (Ser/Thr protein kinase)